jgi:ABC-2 type transport system ATP-binding protein
MNYKSRIKPPAQRPPAHLPGTGPVLQIQQLSKTYDNGIAAVSDLSFDVNAGEVFGLLGPNGAGKSTTMAMLTGTATPSSGSAYIQGTSIQQSRAVRHKIGVAFQDSVLDSEFTGRQNLDLHARLWSMPKREASERINALLNFMSLTARADDNVRTYSGGMRRRLELARALLAHPSLVLLDEPTVGLDPAVRDEIWALVESIRQSEGVAILVSTHYLEEAQAACDRVAIMNHGRIVTVGTPEHLIAQQGAETIEIEVRGNTQQLHHTANAAAQTLGVSTLVRRSTVSIPIPINDQGETIMRKIVESLTTSGFSITKSTLRHTTLADVFAHLTSDQTAQMTEMTETETGTETSIEAGNTTSKALVAA